MDLDGIPEPPRDRDLLQTGSEWLFFTLDLSHPSPVGHAYLFWADSVDILGFSSEVALLSSHFGVALGTNGWTIVVPRPIS